MQFQLPIAIPPLRPFIRLGDKILLVGSCFTGHMARQLGQHGFPVLENPNGILFNPLSVARSLESYMQGVVQPELFYLNELWNSWDYHSHFSHPEKEKAAEQMKASRAQAAVFLKEADWLVITLGSAFQYFLKEENRPVANNHRAPGQWFEKRLLEIDFMAATLSAGLEKLFQYNSKLNIIFTISPVRHIRDGVVDNNRSKARLLETVHRLCHTYSKLYYFPAYELVIDVLRDYRFYDIDMAHPNFAATQFVWEQFMENCIAPEDHAAMQEVKEVFTSLNHRPRFPHTDAHHNFLKRLEEKKQSLQSRFPWLHWPVEN